MLLIETRKTLKHPALWIGMAALTLLLAFAMLVNHLQVANGYQPADGGLEKDLLFGLAFFNLIPVPPLDGYKIVV